MPSALLLLPALEARAQWALSIANRGICVPVWGLRIRPITYPKPETQEVIANFGSCVPRFTMPVTSVDSAKSSRSSPVGDHRESWTLSTGTTRAQIGFERRWNKRQTRSHSRRYVARGRKMTCTACAPSPPPLRSIALSPSLPASAAHLQLVLPLPPRPCPPSQRRYALEWPRACAPAPPPPPAWWLLPPCRVFPLRFFRVILQ